MPSQSSETRAAAGAGRRLGALRELWPFLWPHRLVMLAAFAALVVAAGSVLAIGQAVRRVVDNGFSGDNAFIDLYFLALLGVVTVLALATFARYFLITWLGERVVADMRGAVYANVLTLDPSFYDELRTGEVLSRLTADTTLIQTVVGSSVSIAMRNVLLFLGGGVLLVISSPKLAGLVFIMVPAVVAPIVLIGRRVRRLSRDSQDRVADVSNHAQEGLSAVQTVQAFCHEAVDIFRFNRIAEGAFDTAIRRTRARALLTAVVMLLIFGAVDLVVWIGAKDVIAGEMTGGELAAFVFYAIVVAGALGALSEVYGDLQRAAGATERLIELMNARTQIVDAPVPTPLPKPSRGAVTMQEVDFHYPTRPDDPALSGFSIDVAPGQTVALVGPSGAGKSTVFQLLFRFYDPQAGRLTFDGVDLRDLDHLALRGQLSLVPQDPVIFAASVNANIRYGRPGAPDSEVRSAAEAANALEFIEALPDGFETYLGERGVRLSGGQRQRIAIARAILRNPTVLLLDEATSALDAESERMVQSALERLMADRTTIVIAHRLATVLKADRIFVMDKGRIVESGTHHELLAGGGLYAHYAALQFDLAGASLAAAGE